MDEPLSDKQVIKLAGPGSRVFLYPNIYKLTSIDQIIDEDYPNAIILYQFNDNGNSVYGHWCSIKRINNNKFCFFDSYGGVMDDDQLKYIPVDYRINSKQLFKKLSYLVSKSKYNDINYNEHRYQRNGNNIQTCGRHSAFFCSLPGIDTDQYYKLMNKTKKVLGYDNYDDLIIRLTENFL